MKLAAISLLVVSRCLLAGPKETTPQIADIPMFLALSVEEVEGENVVYRDLLIRDQHGRVLKRLDSAILSPGRPTKTALTKTESGWLLTAEDTLGSGSGVAVNGFRRWKLRASKDGLQVEALPDLVTSSYSLSYKVIDGVEMELCYELQGTPGNYDWVLISTTPC